MLNTRSPSTSQSVTPRPWHAMTNTLSSLHGLMHMDRNHIASFQTCVMLPVCGRRNEQQLPFVLSGFHVCKTDCRFRQCNRQLLAMELSRIACMLIIFSGMNCAISRSIVISFCQGLFLFASDLGSFKEGSKDYQPPNDTYKGRMQNRMFSRIFAPNMRVFAQELQQEQCTSGDSSFRSYKTESDLRAGH